MTAATAPTAPSPIVGEMNGAKKFLRLVVIEHSVFSLPFAYLAALAACFRVSKSVHWVDLLLVTIAMVSARTFAMAFNRIIDRHLDARNPRTRNRELVTGAVSVKNAWIGSGVAIAVFLGAAALLSPLCFALAPLALVPMVVYPYGKRFTWLCHAILGLAQAIAPIGAWIAITGHWSWAAVVLGLGVGTWIGGFDLIYACQDIDSDLSEGVFSYPSRFGAKAALTSARVVHVVTFALFVTFAVLENFGPLFYVALAATAAAFVYEHRIVSPTDLSRVNRSFFTTNGLIGIGLGVVGIADLVVRGLSG